MAVVTIAIMKTYPPKPSFAAPSCEKKQPPCILASTSATVSIHLALRIPIFENTHIMQKVARFHCPSVRFCVQLYLKRY